MSYEADFFASFSPRTALDMVRQTPGFSLDGGDGRRGFSGAVGNVLIDGRFPSTKSQAADEILARIPADQVLRIEVLRGSDVADDASGRALLVNVVRTASGGSGVYETSAESTSRGSSPQGALSYSGRRGELEFDLGASFFSHYRDLRGWRRRYDAAGMLTEVAQTPSRRDQLGASLSGGVALPLAQGRLSATAQLDWGRSNLESDVLAFDAIGAAQNSLFTLLDEREHRYELGLTYESELGPWSFTAMGLIDRARMRRDETGDEFDSTGAVQLSYRQNVAQDRGETIARATLARSLGQRQRIEFGGELAFNTLDQALDFAADPPAPSIPNANVLVEEERAEFFAAHAWRADETWFLETRLALETSTLAFAGDANQTREFSYWKPSLQLSRTLAQPASCGFASIAMSASSTSINSSPPHL